MIKIIFWSSFFIIFYTYFGYITLCILLSKLFGRRVKKEEIYPFMSVIIPCYNEERVIRSKIENLLSLDYPKDKLQIIIVSESTDKTNAIVCEYKDKGVELYPYQARVGKTTLLYNTVPKAKGEIIVFSDANAILKSDAFKKISANFYEERVGAVTGFLMIANPRSSAISRGETIYKKYEATLRRANSLSGSVLNSDGSLFAIRRKLYKPISPERGDDFELIIQVLINGYYSVFEPEAVSSEDASVTSKAETARKIRMVSWFFKSSMILLKEMFLKFKFGLIFQLVSHKLLRWFSPYFLIALFITNFILRDEGIVYQFSLLFQILFYVAGILGMYLSEVKKKSPPFILGALDYFLTFNYAFLIGTAKGLFASKASSPLWEKVRL